MKNERSLVTKDKGSMGFAAKPPATCLISTNPPDDKKALPLHTGEAGFSDSYDSNSASPKILLHILVQFLYLFSRYFISVAYMILAH